MSGQWRRSHTDFKGQTNMDLNSKVIQSKIKHPDAKHIYNVTVSTQYTLVLSCTQQTVNLLIHEDAER